MDLPVGDEAPLQASPVRAGEEVLQDQTQSYCKGDAKAYKETVEPVPVLSMTIPITFTEI